MLLERHDGAMLNIGGARLAFTTDSYVVQPLFFPGGDIGTLAINGTVNDLAMCGARPLYLSSALILEEGLPMETLRRVIESMRSTAAAANVQLVTGDTKVVDKGKGDGIFINTAGIGRIGARSLDLAQERPSRRRNPAERRYRPPRHRYHGHSRRLVIREHDLESDCALLWPPVEALLAAGIELHCLRDLTRGGLSSGLIEIAEVSGTRPQVEEAAVPACEAVVGACEILGLDPLYLANEGRFVAFVAPQDADQAVDILRGFSVSSGALRIGRVLDGPSGLVTMKTRLGTERVLDMLSGEQLPRIC